VNGGSAALNEAKDAVKDYCQFAGSGNFTLKLEVAARVS
jgi:hypothetical protein